MKHVAASTRISRARSKSKGSAAQMVRLLRRVVILGALIVYISVGIRSSVSSMHVLRGHRNAPVDVEYDDASLISGIIGNGSIRESPLVTKVLGNDLTPRNEVLFLNPNEDISTERCSTTSSDTMVDTYKVIYMRQSAEARNVDTSYSVTELAQYSVVAVLVDCSFPPLIRDDPHVLQAYTLLRHHENVDDVILDVARFSMQDYNMKEQKEKGPIGVAMHHLVRDMRDQSILQLFYTGLLQYPFQYIGMHVYKRHGTNELGWSIMQRAPRFPLDPPKVLETSSRTGFYVRSDTEQANIMEAHIVEYKDPLSALTKWRWQAVPHLRDSWAWVHMLHAVFAMNELYNIIVLLIVVVHNYRKSQIWMGDAFASVSTTLPLRAGLILCSWVVNGYWTLMEFILHDAHHIAGTREIFFFPEIIRADLLTLYLACVHLIGICVRERIDPAVAIVTFELGYTNRFTIIHWFSSIRQVLTDFAVIDQIQSIQKITQVAYSSSPIRQWSTHTLPALDLRVIVSGLFPIFIFGVFFALLYVLLRKIYRHARPGSARSETINTQSKHITPTSATTNENQQTVFKRSFTLFEVATGAELQSRYGIVADYENCRVIKGLKYASADGIFGTGFVIANDKYLVAVSDLYVIALMKLTHVRMKNVHVYEVTGNMVQQTARLVYLDTLSWGDLTHLNVTILS